MLHFYTLNCDENSVLRTRKGNCGHKCNSCNEFLLLSSVKPLRNILLKRSALFRKIVDIQYKTTLVESYQSAIHSFIKAPHISISSSGVELFHKRKSHHDIHIELKVRLPEEKICPSGYPIVQFPGAD